ncbi:hypothetical protein Klosneuvirus_5_106 [Klosneuvirus KNV1]|uniref:NUDIX hydrolase n=1 Tax=Klosneuvirus KNV1 TaxID=1977640 RepID=A0A1V0SL55_9VIRU|nr:hypothetical protein Klosneuvirus_5_106 [Klosneuvirus KNV1]
MVAYATRFDKMKTTKIVTENSLYVRYLRTDITKRIYVSCCYFSGLLECLEEIYKSKSDAYIICIGYTDGDFQIALTGTGKFKEHSLNTAQRETFEEVDIESDNIQFFNTYQHNGAKVKVSHVYKVDASECTSSTKSRNDLINLDHDNNKKHKITVVIYGSLAETTKIIQSSRLDPRNREHIGFYVLLRVSDAISICKKIISEGKINDEVPYKYDV